MFSRVAAERVCASDRRSVSGPLIPRMAMHIFVDQENDPIGTTAGAKDRLRLLSAPSKAFVEKTCPKTPLAGRSANFTSTSHPIRKALGNANRTLTTTKNRIQKGQKSSAKKGTENLNRVDGYSMVTEDCPEKENIFPYNPLDSESFDVPEEHRLSHLTLSGVPLMIFDKAADRFESMILAPVEQPISWGYDTFQPTSDFLESCDEIIDLPSPL